MAVISEFEDRIEVAGPRLYWLEETKREHPTAKLFYLSDVKHEVAVAEGEPVAAYSTQRQGGWIAL